MKTHVTLTAVRERERERVVILNNKKIEHKDIMYLCDFEISKII